MEHTKERRPTKSKWAKFIWTYRNWGSKHKACRGEPAPNPLPIPYGLELIVSMGFLSVWTSGSLILLSFSLLLACLIQLQCEFFCLFILSYCLFYYVFVSPQIGVDSDERWYAEKLGARGRRNHDQYIFCDKLIYFQQKGKILYR